MSMFAKADPLPMPPNCGWQRREAVSLPVMGVGSLLGNFESWPNLFQRSSLWFVQSGKSFLLLTKSSFTADWFLSTISVRNFNSYAAEEYGRIRPDLERKGTTIGPMDMLIEAHIAAEDFVFVKNNAREVERVEAVEVEDWTKKEQLNWISVKIVKWYLQRLDTCVIMDLLGPLGWKRKSDFILKTCEWNSIE